MAGSRAASAREPGQIREEAALSDTARAPRTSLAGAEDRRARPRSEFRRRVHGPLSSLMADADNVDLARSLIELWNARRHRRRRGPLHGGRGDDRAGRTGPIRPSTTAATACGPTSRSWRSVWETSRIEAERIEAHGERVVASGAWVTRGARERHRGSHAVRHPADASRMGRSQSLSGSQTTTKPSPPLAAPDLDILRVVERRVLWLATAIVHHANRVRETRSGVKVGGHQASSASMVSLMTALWFSELRAEDRVSVKPHASPVLHAINYLLGRLDQPYLESLREFGGLQSYPSRTKDPDPVDYSTGSVGIGATAPVWSAIARRYLEYHRLEAPPMGRQIALLGDAELDEGAVWEAIADPVGRAPRRGALGGRPEPPVARPRRAGHRLRPAGRDVRGGRLAGDHGQVRPPARRPVRARRRRASCAAASTRCRTRSTSGCCALDAAELRERLPGADARAREAGGRARRRRAARRLPRPRRPRPRQADRRLPRRRPRPADGGLRLHDQGLVAADRGPPGEPLGAADARAVRGARRRAGHRRRAPWARFEPGSPEGDLCAAAATALARDEPEPREPPPVPPTLGRKHRGQESTQQAFGRFFVDLVHEAPEVAERVVTVSPDVASSTNLGGWINKAGIWSVGERRDWFADDPQTLVHWKETTARRAHRARHRRDQPGRACSGELGATWSRYGQPLLPDRHDLRPVRRPCARAVVVRDLRGRPVNPGRHPVGRLAGARGRRASVDRHALDRDRAARLHAPGSPPSGRTSSGRCCTRSLSSAGRAASLPTSGSRRVRSTRRWRAATRARSAAGSCSPAAIRCAARRGGRGSRSSGWARSCPS